MADLQVRLQSTLGSAYRIERELGGGGISRVFLAQERELGRQVVVKVLPPEMAARKTPAGRLYWENKRRGPTSSAVWKTTELSLPVAVTNFQEDAYQPPESWVRRAYKNLIYFHEVPKGGHFAAWAQLELFAAELRAAFKSLR